jgi:predicted ABC-type ATPase
LNDLSTAVGAILSVQAEAGKPLAIIVAGHNGSGKSTMWYRHLAPRMRVPLINADRMMLSILPELNAGGRLPAWAQELRDTDENWMVVARQSVDSFVVNAMQAGVPFAYETVFSHWRELPGGVVESKIDRIRELQAAGYFVLLIFVGLANVELSVGRVLTRHANGGHTVPNDRLLARFPKTQRAIANAIPVADASILVDNSADQTKAFTVARVQEGARQLFDIRATGKAPRRIIDWLDKVAPSPT